MKHTQIITILSKDHYETLTKLCINWVFTTSLVVMECQLCVTLNHNPERKLEEGLNMFDKVESPGPDVASMIRQVSMHCNYGPV